MKDLTKGSPAKLIFAFAMPLLAGNIFQLFYNMADIRIVGQTLGDEAVAAVAATSPINSLIIGFLMGLTNGFAIVISKYFGAKLDKEMKNCIGLTVVLGLVFSVVLTIASAFLIKPFLSFLNTPDNIMDCAYSYISVILFGMTAAMLYNMCSGILRALGDTVTPLIFLVIGALTNIGLDFWFIMKLNTGVEGAAYATVISQALSFVLCFIYMLVKYPMLHLKKQDFTFDKDIAYELIRSGISMGFMLSFVAIGTVALQSAINTFGEQTIVAHLAARKIIEMMMMPVSLFAAATATFSSQNYGAGCIDRIKTGIKQSILMMWIWCVIAIIITYTFSEKLITMLTTTTDTFVIETAITYLKFNTPFLFAMVVLVILRNAMQGIGDRLTPVLSSLIELAGKFAVVIFLKNLMGYWGVIISEPIVWILCSILLITRLARNPIFANRKNV